jgi:hypothetical protein
MPRWDLGRSISVLGEAIDRVNRIDSPDFNPSNQSLVKYWDERAIRAASFFTLNAGA